MDIFNLQMHGISKGLKVGDLQIADVGEIVPASLMVHDLDGLQPIGCTYMNNWGCERLGTSVDEINHLGESYYDQYFVKEESKHIFVGMDNYLKIGDFDKQYNFFQRVKLHKDDFYTWFYTVLKVVSFDLGIRMDHKIIILSSPIIGMDHLISRVNKTLEQNSFIQNNYKKFALLTKREKEIIKLVANGKSTKEIAEMLFLSPLTVSTHRKNLIRKIECENFSDLLKFAVIFDLI